MIQRVSVFLISLLFVSTFLQAKTTINEIIFPKAVVYFKVGDSDNINQSYSNSVKLKLKDTNRSIVDQNTTKPFFNEEILFYRYDNSSNSYIDLRGIKYLDDKSNIKPMPPIRVEDKELSSLYKSFPILKCSSFKKGEAIIVIYKAKKISKRSFIDIVVSNNKDNEIIRLKRAESEKREFVGYINTTTKCQQKHDGKLYIEDGMKILAYPYKKDSIKTKISRDTNRLIFAQAIIDESNNTKDLKVLNSDINESKIWIESKADKSIVSTSEHVKISCTIKNSSNKDIEDGYFKNRLSKGLSYESGSFRLDGKKIKGLSLDKREIGFSLNIKANESKTLTFIIRVDSFLDGKLSLEDIFLFDKNRAKRSKIYLKVEDSFESRSVISGKFVYNGNKNISLDGIKVYLDLGIYSVSDNRGRFHFENIPDGVHVVSVDPQSIEGRFELDECKNSFHNLGSKGSSIVDTSVAKIKDVEFCLKKDRSVRVVDAKLSFKSESKEDHKMPKYNKSSFKDLKKRSSFLWPKEGYVPPMPSIKVALLHPSNKKATLYLNGKKVDMLNFDGDIKSDDGWTISKYRGVDIVDGDNILEAKIEGESKSIKRVIHLSTSPIKAELIRTKSNLIADGISNPVIAIRLSDSAGYPLREGMTGVYEILKPYIPQDRFDALRKNPLAQDSKNHYLVSYDGIAYIRLHPTTKSGEVKIHFPFQNQNEYIKAWLSPSKRDWFIVGFAKGSFAYKKIKESLKKSRKKDIISNDQVSLFAKGSISKDTLLTIAYNSGKKRDKRIKTRFDPKESFAVYGDSSIQIDDAPSSKKLYVKIEKRDFYALFGDFDTALDTHELSRYKRMVNGIKSEFKGEIFDYNLFVSKSKDSFFKEEIEGDGTSGFYHLKNKNIKVGSESITIEVRDRYRDEIVISKRVLRSVLDYSIDYENGTVYFKEPISHTDSNLNPKYIVITYQKEGSGNQRLTFGGRVALKGFDKRDELGVTAINSENTDGKFDSLYGVDLRVEASKNLTINAEYAKTTKKISKKKDDAKAYLLSLSHHNSYSESKIYYRLQDKGFGIGEESSSQSGKVKYGVDYALHYWQNIAIKLALYSQKSLNRDHQKDVGEIFGEYHKRDLSAVLGLRYANESEKAGESQFITKFSKSFFKNRFKVSTAYEHTLGDSADIFANRYFAELSYFLNQYIEIFANHEILKSDNIDKRTNRVGIKGKAWRGLNINSSINKEFKDDNYMVYGALGINQSYYLRKDLLMSASYEKQRSFKNSNLDSSKDFTAYSLGLNYRKRNWIYNLKGEYREAKEEKKRNLYFGAYSEIGSDIGFLLSLKHNDELNKNKKSTLDSIKISSAYRPKDSFLLFGKFGFEMEKVDKKESQEAFLRVLSMLKLSANNIFYASYALKYLRESIDNQNYNTFVDRFGFEYFYQLNKRSEIGFNSTLFHIYKSSDLKSSLGIVFGFNLFKNLYLALGYNFVGYSDDLFERSLHQDRGVFLNFKIKFDKEGLEDIVKSF